MGFGGVLAKLATVRGQKHEKPCERCGLYYNREREEECPHCAQLNDSELQQLEARKEAEEQANKSLGKMFLLVAAVVLVAILVMFAS